MFKNIHNLLELTIVWTLAFSGICMLELIDSNIFPEARLKSSRKLWVLIRRRIKGEILMLLFLSSCLNIILMINLNFPFYFIA